jgi:hypothetical protein
VYTGTSGLGIVADVARTGISGLPAAYGANHGFDVTYAAGPGKQTVCAYGIEIAGTGSNASLGCRTVTVPTGSPVGVIDYVSAGAGVIYVAGWAFDPDTAASIPVHVYTDGSGLSFMADQARPDVAAAYPGYGPNHGFNYAIPASSGVHTVCIYGIEIAGSGANSLRGCRTVTVP